MPSLQPAYLPAMNIGIHWLQVNHLTLTLDLGPELEASLVERAQAGGKTPQEYILSVVEDSLLRPAAQGLPPEERAAAFEKWSARHRPMPLLSDEAVSRESIYTVG